MSTEKPKSRVQGQWNPPSRRSTGSVGPSTSNTTSSAIQQRRSFGSTVISLNQDYHDAGDHPGYGDKQDYSKIDRVNAKKDLLEQPQRFGSSRLRAKMICRGETLLSEEPSGRSVVRYYPDFISKHKARLLFEELHPEEKVPWRFQQFKKDGQLITMPRKMAWYGPTFYKFAGAKLDTESNREEKWPDAVEEIHQLVKKFTGTSFNSVLLNLYRDGSDGVSWHSDNESLMGLHPTIASISLGATRVFQLRKNPKDGEEEDMTEMYQVELTDGSLIIMEDHVQDDWKHRIKKESAPPEVKRIKPRINLTFRNVFDLEAERYNPRKSYDKTYSYDTRNVFDLEAERSNPRKSYDKTYSYDTRSSNRTEEASWQAGNDTSNHEDRRNIGNGPQNTTRGTGWRTGNATSDRENRRSIDNGPQNISSRTDDNSRTGNATIDLETRRKISNGPQNTPSTVEGDFGAGNDTINHGNGQQNTSRRTDGTWGAGTVTSASENRRNIGNGLRRRSEDFSGGTEESWGTGNRTNDYENRGSMGHQRRSEDFSGKSGEFWDAGNGTSDHDDWGNSAEVHQKRLDGFSDQNTGSRRFQEPVKKGPIPRSDYYFHDDRTSDQDLTLRSPSDQNITPKSDPTEENWLEESDRTVEPEIKPTGNQKRSDQRAPRFQRTKKMVLAQIHSYLTETNHPRPQKGQKYTQTPPKSEEPPTSVLVKEKQGPAKEKVSETVPKPGKGRGRGRGILNPPTWLHEMKKTT